MKKIFNIIFAIIPIYLISFILNNCRNLFFNYKNQNFIFENIEIINMPIIVSLIAIAFIVLINRGKILKNKVFISSIIAILGISILNGIFKDKNLNNYILLYFFILIESFVISRIIKQKFNISIFILTIFMIIFMTILAIINLLVITKYFLICLSIVSIIYLIYVEIKNKGINVEQLNEKSLGIMIFSIMFIVFIAGGINRYIHIYDEYSHWAFDAKAVIEYDKLSTCEEVMSPTRHYTPALSVWHYLIHIFINSTNESHLYIGLSIFILIALMPCFSFIKKGNKILTPVFVIAIYFSCYLLGDVYNYTALYADYALSAVFTSSIIFTIIFKDNTKQMKRYLLLGFILCCLIKPAAIVLTGTFVLIEVIKEILENKQEKYNFKIFCYNFKLAIKKWWKIGVVLLLVFIGWNVYIKICNNTITNYYDFRLLPPSLETSITAKLNLYTIGRVLYNLLNSLNSTIIYSFVELKLYQYIIFMIIMGVFIVYLNKKHEKNCSYKTVIAYIIGYFVFFGLTFISIFLMLTKYEAENLASFGRYLNPFHFAILILLIVNIFKEIDLKAKSKRDIVLCVVLLIYIAGIGINNILYFICDYPTERKATYDVSYERQEKFKIVNDNTPKNSKVYVIDQTDKDGIMAMWYSRYYMFPRRVNASSSVIGWKIRTEKNSWDLMDWGLTSIDLQNQLYKYDFDYLFLYTYDEEFFEQISFMLEVPFDEVINKYTLFKVQKNDNNITLLPVI